MKLAHVLEGGLTGATTLALLQESLHGLDGKTPRSVPMKPELLKKLRKKDKKGRLPAAQLYIELAGELLGAAAFFGLTGLGKKKNALLRGGLLGAAAGLGMAFVQNEEKDPTQVLPEPNGADMWHKLATVALYAAGGVLAGAAVQQVGRKQLKKAKKVKKKL